MSDTTEKEGNVIESAENQALEVCTKASAHAAEILGQIEGLVIKTQSDCLSASNILKSVKTAYKLLETRRKETVKPINDAKAKVQGLFKPDLEKYQEAEGILKKAIGVFQSEQEKIRQIEQEKLRLKAAKEEEKRKATLAAQAAKAEEKGNLEKAESLTQQAEEYHQPVAIVQAPPKVNGISYKSTWKARIFDVSQLPRNYMVPNNELLQGFARSTKGKIPIPGVEFYEDKSIAVRQ